MSVIQRAVVATVAAASLATFGVHAATATPVGPPLPVEFDLAKYHPVNPAKYQSLAFADNGRSFFVAGRWLCAFGPSYRYVSCKGAPATAPPRTQGALISGDQQGPWWVTPAGIFGPNTQLTPTSGFRPPTLSVGNRLTVNGSTCTAPRPDVVACTTGSRAMILTAAWHKFFYPAGDIAHNANPAPQYLPPRLQRWNQLPLWFSPPK
ncbi:hypothetical protein HH308_19970 [Gordonia sp. TBRC 11910]|uniref:Secreted protein n=1 Tax=Gordonia asplenii TaxID=2725283 RepID=A0A848KY26_9ACTN|nr:hypothetical protein [Gordonia asplenii]NMO03496.1 hypothetical protein [Gordonia asplenii]